MIGLNKKPYNIKNKQLRKKKVKKKSKIYDKILNYFQNYKLVI